MAKKSFIFIPPFYLIKTASHSKNPLIYCNVCCSFLFHSCWHSISVILWLIVKATSIFCLQLWVNAKSEAENGVQIREYCMPWQKMPQLSKVNMTNVNKESKQCFDQCICPWQMSWSCMFERPRNAHAVRFIPPFECNWGMNWYHVIFVIWGWWIWSPAAKDGFQCNCYCCQSFSEPELDVN